MGGSRLWPWGTCTFHIAHRAPLRPAPTHAHSPSSNPHIQHTQVLHRLGTHPTSGLTDAQAASSRAVHGANELPPDPTDPLWRRLARQFDDLLVKILVAAAVVDLAISFVNGETGAAAFVEPGVIVAILIANAAVGVATEANAERALAELRAYEVDAAVVVRGGRVVTIPAAALVPGDLIHLAVGARVPADARLVRVDGGRGEIRVDQSLLTGESDSVVKTSAPLPPSPDRGGGATASALVAQDKANIVFAGTLVTAGRASVVVVATGGATAMGAVRAAVAASDDDAPTPLKQKLDEFGVVLSRIIAAVCITVWIVNVPRFRDPAHGGWVGGAVYYFKIAVALAVAAIPEGLPAVVTTCLALGTRKMAARNAIVRSLPAVETLGCTTVIASDKTGTLTTNQMTVVTLAVADGRGGVVTHGVTGAGFAPRGAVLQAGSATTAPSPLPTPASHPALAFAAACSALCNDAELEAGPGGSVTRVGEATEAALRAAAEKIGVPPPGGLLAPPRPPPPLPSGSRRLAPVNDAWRAAAPRCAALEFCRSRKMMSVLTRPAGGGNAATTTAEGGGTLWVKGAPEAVLARCTHAVSAGPSGARTPLDPSGRDALLAAAAAGARASALRWLALASRELPAGAPAPTTDDEQGLTLLALVGLRDPPRPEARAAVTACRAAGVRVLMVTGDGADTAAAVARDVGILAPGPPPSGALALGADFAALSPAAAAAAAAHLCVLARVEPAHKATLVRALRSGGAVVAVTGDGVNDAPALRAADVGVAMGGGTAVARAAADVVLADDNFATVVAAVAEGRAIYANTKQFIRYMVSSNVGEVVAIFAATALGLPEILTPAQLLWVNLVTDGPPATALGFNPPDPRSMRTPPRGRSDAVVSGWLLTRYLLVGAYVGAATAASFVWWFVWAPAGPRAPLTALIWSAPACAGTASPPPWCAAISDGRTARTVALTTLVCVEMFNALNALSEDASLASVGPTSNPALLVAIALSMLLHAAVLYIRPLGALFGTMPLGASEWGAVLALSAPVILVDECLKAVSRRKAAGLPILPPAVARALATVMGALPPSVRRAIATRAERWSLPVLARALSGMEADGSATHDDEGVELLPASRGGSAVRAKRTRSGDERWE